MILYRKLMSATPRDRYICMTKYPTGNYQSSGRTLCQLPPSLYGNASRTDRTQVRGIIGTSDIENGKVMTHTQSFDRPRLLNKSLLTSTSSITHQRKFEPTIIRPNATSARAKECMIIECDLHTESRNGDGMNSSSPLREQIHSSAQSFLFEVL